LNISILLGLFNKHRRVMNYLIDVGANCIRPFFRSIPVSIIGKIVCIINANGLRRDLVIFLYNERANSIRPYMIFWFLINESYFSFYIVCIIRPFFRIICDVIRNLLIG